MKINCIIVDDEPMARDLLVNYVSEVPALNLAGVCSSALEAAEMIVRQEIHLIFLDINMPLLSGIKFYRSLSRPPAVIFTTAYPEYALEGFELDAVDYLLKPFSFERFYKAVTKMMERHMAGQKTSEEEFILLRSEKKMHRVTLSQICCIEALGGYLKIYLNDRHLVVHQTLKNILESLPESFIQVHKSWIVALVKIDYIEGNTARAGKHEIPLGQKYKERLMAALNGISY